MSWPLGIAAYVVIWWIVIFAVLPFGVKPAEEGDPGHAAGAPAQSRMMLKAVVTTIIGAAIWLCFFWAVHDNLVSFRGP